MKSSSIKGFPRFIATDEQRISATPKRKATRSNRVEGAKCFGATSNRQKCESNFHFGPQRLAPRPQRKTLEEAEMLPLRFFLLGKPEYTEDAKNS